MGAVVQNPKTSKTSTAFIEGLYTQNINDLVFRAQGVHRKFHRTDLIQKSTLLSIRTGGCKEDCAYCAQSKFYETGLKPEKMVDLEVVLERAKAAKSNGSSRFCMGASGTRVLNDKNFEKVLVMVREVKALGLETCVTLGMLDEAQARRLKAAGLDFYNHNLDTSPEHYGQIITTRGYQERLDTLKCVRRAKIKVCTGGILGMGESRQDRFSFLRQLRLLRPYPESVTINRLVPIKGTPLENCPPIEPIEIIRTIATARILMPKATIRLSAGRETMSDSLQALAFLAGANSIFSGEKLLTTPNVKVGRDHALLSKLGLQATPMD